MNKVQLAAALLAVLSISSCRAESFAEGESRLVSPPASLGYEPGQVGRDAEDGDVKVSNSDGTWSWRKPAIYQVDKCGVTFDLKGASDRIEDLEKRVERLEARLQKCRCHK